MNKLNFAFAGNTPRKNMNTYATDAYSKALIAFSLAFVLGACSPEFASTNTATQTPSANTLSLTQWLDEKYEEELQFSPIQMTFLGRKERNDEIDEFTYEAFAEQMNWKQASAKEMQEQFDYADLSDDEKLSYDLWAFQAQQMVDSAEFFHNGLTFDQMNGIQSFVPTFLINFHSVDTEADMQAYISRIKAVGPRMQEALVNAQTSSNRGVITPGFALDGVIEQTKAIITGQPFETTARKDSDLWSDIKTEVTKLQEQNLINAASAEALLKLSLIHI